MGTAPEQKTESAKNGKDSMSLPFFQSLRVQQVAPTSLFKGGKEVYFIRCGLTALSIVLVTSFWEATYLHLHFLR